MKLNKEKLKKYLQPDAYDALVNGGYYLIPKTKKENPNISEAFEEWEKRWNMNYKKNINAFTIDSIIFKGLYPAVRIKESNFIAPYNLEFLNNFHIISVDDKAAKVLFG